MIANSMAAVIGLTSGSRILSSSCYSADITEKFFSSSDHSVSYYRVPSKKCVILARKSFPSSKRNPQSIKALKEHVHSPSISSSMPTRFRTVADTEDEGDVDHDYTVEALLLLQKSLLEKQWNLSFDGTGVNEKSTRKASKKLPVYCSGVSARQRRISARKEIFNQSSSVTQASAFKQLRSVVSPELLQYRWTGYVTGAVSEELLSHSDVVRLSRLIKWGLTLEDCKFRLKGKLGCDPSNEQLAAFLNLSRAELQSQLIACSLAREKLAMSNVRLVMSIAQRYDNMGAEMADLVQGGLIGLLRGIEKFDSSKGFKISTYVYWWIRQGVSRALVDNSRTLRLPNHLHERLSLIRNAKIRLQEKGITPSIDRIAENLNMSQKKVKNATEAISKVFSLDREAFPSLNGLPGETHHSYIADRCLENNPWHGVDGWALRDEVNKLIDMTLREREQEIVRLYYGLDKECLTWEDISKRIGLSRERVRQVGLVALEKLKLAARKKKMEAMLVKH